MDSNEIYQDIIAKLSKFQTSLQCAELSQKRMHREMKIYETAKDDIGES